MVYLHNKKNYYPKGFRRILKKLKLHIWKVSHINNSEVLKIEFKPSGIFLLNGQSR
jgi:hypothetical protein